MSGANEARRRSNLFYLFEMDRRDHPMPPERAAMILRELQRMIVLGGIDKIKDNRPGKGANIPAMNEFKLFEQLCVLEGIANQYPTGVEYGKRFRDTADRIVSQLYRVAVIGEFKRGKSSLVNAIIGAQVLPTDILPMTAAVTRVTYGEKKRIQIRFKDGHEEERTVEELIDFATKFDAQKEKTAAQIREIQVCYPSVFCKNHIDLLDTPGLNDNEAMTELTLGVLENIDAAIMVISAKSPLSLTEQSLILNMIGKRQIRHIIFVVTHIDAVSSKAAAQDQMIDFIRRRISTDLLTAAEEKWSEDSYYRDKARRILGQPDIFGVSSVLAMDGFIHDDEGLLEESRFPHFKSELLALLTAAQSEDVQAKTLEAAMTVKQLLPQWLTAATHALDAQYEALLQKRADFHDYTGRAEQLLADRLRQMQDSITAEGLGIDGLCVEDLTDTLLRPFIRGLGAIREWTNTDEQIRAAICSGAQATRAEMAGLHKRLLDAIEKNRTAVEDWLDALCRSVGLPEAEERFIPREIPSFWFPDQLLLPADGVLKGTDVMPRIRKAMASALEVYGRGLTEYVARWRITLYHRIKSDLTNQSVLERISQELDEIDAQRNILQVNRRQNEQKLEAVLTALELRQ